MFGWYSGVYNDLKNNVNNKNCLSIINNSLMLYLVINV